MLTKYKLHSNIYYDIKSVPAKEQVKVDGAHKSRNQVRTYLVKTSASSPHIQSAESFVEKMDLLKECKR